MKNNFIRFLLPLFFFLYTGIILFFNRTLFFTSFDIPYWQERFEQSQWSLPFSDRIIGDEGLYAYEGYSYAKGADPTLSNAEAPPLGKYLIGWSILLFGNPYWIGLTLTLFSIMIFYFLAKKTASSRFLALGGTVLFALDPLVFEQTTSVMLDAPQLFFLLLCLSFFLWSIQTKSSYLSSLYIFVSGLFLGAFSATKIPMLTPFFLMTMVVYVRKSKLPVIFYTFLLLCGTAASYLFSYAKYFQLNHSIIEWLRIQKWMITFYQESNLSPTYGSIVTTLLLNKSQNFFTKLWETGDIWSFTWPIISIIFVLLLVFFAVKRVKKTLSDSILLCFTAMIFIFYSIIPFSTRYLLILLPFLYLVALRAISFMKSKRLPYALLILLCVGNCIASCTMLFPTPERDLKQFIYDWERGYFSDMYERLDRSSKNTDRKSFHFMGQTYLKDGTIEKASISVLSPVCDRFSRVQSIPIQVTYKTQSLGEFTERKHITVVKENNRWRFHWNYSDLLEGLTPEAHFSSTVDFAKRGSVTSNGKLIAYDFPSLLISIIPNEVDITREQHMNSYIESLFDKDVEAASIHDRYIIARIPHFSVPVGVLPDILSYEQWETLLSFSGVLVTPAMGRKQIPKNASGQIWNSLFKECCSYLYSTSSYDGISGIEQEYNDELKGINGGTLQIVKKDESIIRTIIDQEKIDGKNIFLP